jgi:hypothetical protein
LRFTDEVQNLFDHAAGNARASLALRDDKQAKDVKREQPVG